MLARCHDDFPHSFLVVVRWLFGAGWPRCVFPLVPTRVLDITIDPFYVIQVPVWKYACLAVADVEGNYFAVKAYQYTSITSVMLLDCFTIPCVMVLSKIFLHAKVTDTAFHC